jgi:hypothetical protein
MIHVCQIVHPSSVVLRSRYMSTSTCTYGTMITVLHVESSESSRLTHPRGAMLQCTVAL